MFLIRGLVFTHEAGRDWEAKLAPLLAEGLRQRRAGKVGRCWHVDETYVKVAGAWCYLYRGSIATAPWSTSISVRPAIRPPPRRSSAPPDRSPRSSPSR